MYTTEPLSGGLVTARDPAFLMPGELQRAENAFYFPNDDAIYRAPGISSRANYFTGITSGTQKAINSLVAVRFDGGQQYIIGQGTDALAYFDPEVGGNMLEAFTGYSTADRLNAVHFKNHWYLFNGVNDNLVFKTGGVVRRHGLLPVTSAPTTSDSGTPFSLGTNSSGIYEYWYTEVAKYGDGDDVECAYSATNPVLYTVQLPTSSHAPRITFPAPFNPNEATHRRVYRSASLHVANDAYIFPTGYMVAELPISTTSWVDGGTATNSSSFASSADSDVARYDSGAPVIYNGTFTDEINAATSGVDVATFDRGTAASPNTTRSRAVRSFMIWNYALSTSGSITGITVDIRCRATQPSNSKIWLALAKRTSANTAEPMASLSGFSGVLQTSSLTKDVVGLSSTMSTYSIGSSNDDWLPADYAWTTDVVNSSAFAVIVNAEMVSPATSASKIEIESVKLTVTHSGSDSIVYGKTYDAITIEQDGEQVSFSANQLPPKASMGAAFQSSLVTNTIEKPRVVVWSNPGDADSFPTDAYYLDEFAGKEGDEITFIGTVNERLIVGMRGSIWRVNYLPNENDASINRGDAVSPISTSVGIVHSKAACTFVTSNGTEGLAFVSPNGIFATGGADISPIGGDLKWVGTNGVIAATSFDVSQVKCLFNDPATQTIRLLVADGNEYAMSYAARHRKELGGKWTGPIDYSVGTRRPNSGVNVRLSTGAYLTHYGYSSTATSGVPSVWREDPSDTPYANSLQGTNAKMVVRTRDLYPADLQGEVQLHGILWHGERLSGATTGPDCTGTIYMNFLQSSSTTAAIEPVAGTNAKLLFASVADGRCNGFSVELTQTTSDAIKLHKILSRLESFGEVDYA